MLDDDVVPRPGLVSGHGAWHLTANDLVVLGYMPVAAGAGGPSRLYARSYARACHTFDAGSDAVLRGLWAGNLSLRRTHWLRATEAPWNDPGYHGDQELGLRLLQLGLRGVFDRTLKAEHRYAPTLDGMIRDAEDAAASSVRLRRAYGDLVPAAQPQPPRVAAVTRLLVRLVGPRRSWSVMSALLRAAARVSGSAGMVRLEDRSVSLLYRLAYERALADGSKW